MKHVQRATGLSQKQFFASVWKNKNHTIIDVKTYLPYAFIAVETKRGAELYIAHVSWNNQYYENFSYAIYHETDPHSKRISKYCPKTISQILDPVDHLYTHTQELHHATLCRESFEVYQKITLSQPKVSSGMTIDFGTDVIFTDHTSHRKLIFMHGVTFTDGQKRYAIPRWKERYPEFRIG